MIKIRRKEVPLAQEKLPTLSAQQKNQFPKGPTSGWLYFFDPLPLFTTILSSLIFLNKMHIGMAEYIDEPSELWHSRSWSASIRSCSGDFAHYPNGEPIFPSDIVLYQCLEEMCHCQAEPPEPHYGRVFSVGRDRTASALRQGEIAIQVQVL